MKSEDGRPRTILVALGGNAILRAGQVGTADEQRANIALACRQIAALSAQGYRILVVHGNGPQVGQILLQNEAASPAVPAMPLDICGAQSQGMLGYLIQQVLGNELALRGLDIPVVSLVTQVVVDGADPAFHHPTKPVGPFYSEAEADRLRVEQGWQMVSDSGRGWRQVVPSPRPGRIVEGPSIHKLIDSGAIVIAGGGGGIPVVEGPGGLSGVAAVIDKDLAAQALATAVGADILALLTDVPQVSIHFGQPEQRDLDRINIADAERFAAEGHFPAGSMLSKVEACVAFVRATGGEAVIAASSALVDAVAGHAGTRITAGADEQTA